jgi:hypothetical protein
MKRQSLDRTGVLIVRLWIEANHERGLRARITQTLDTTATEQSVAVAASADDICVVVKRWVEDFEGANSRDGHGQVSLAEPESS